MDIKFIEVGEPVLIGILISIRKSILVGVFAQRIGGEDEQLDPIAQMVSICISSQRVGGVLV